MRGWLIGGNLFLGGVLATMLVVMPFMERSRTEAGALEGQVTAPPVAASEPEPAREDPKVIFALGVALDTLRDMKGSMRDPGSARFRNLWAINIGTDDEPLIAVCGEVNAKNGFGGHTGFVPFIVAGSLVLTPGEVGFENRFVQNCIPERRITPVSF